MNNKGFTLTELLVTLALIGVVTGIAFPAISNLRSQNDTKQYEAFANVLISSAKLYHETSTETKITYNDMKAKGFISNAKVGSQSCEASYVVINNGEYCAHVRCGSKEKYKSC